MKIWNFLKKDKESIYLDSIFEKFNGIRNGDVYLVGFPKSGNTWLRFLIGNYLSEGKCNFVNSHEFFPGLSEHTELCNNLRSPRFMSTHFSYRTFNRFARRYDVDNSKNVKVVFLVRDGRDVAVSYYYHLIKNGKINKSLPFHDFIVRFENGDFNPFENWSTYVTKWVKHGPESFNFMITRYRDLLADARASLTRILEFAELPVDGSRLNIAVAASTFEKMKKLEEEGKDKHFRLKNSDANLMFVRSGRSGNWSKEFDRRSLEAFYKTNKRALVELGYYTGL